MSLSPRLFFMNPSCEMAVASGGASYTAPKRIAKLERDLEQVPIWLSQEGDFTLVEEMPSKEFRDYIGRVLGFTPQFILPNGSSSNGSLTEELYRLAPWGWSPNISERSLSDKLRRHVKIESGWFPDLTNYISREFSMQLLREVVEITRGLGSDSNANSGSGSDSDFSSGSGSDLGTVIVPYVPQKIDNVDDVISIIENQGVSVLKSPWSSAGRGICFIRGNNLTPSDINWVKGVIKSQGFIMVERLFDRVLDFSLHFDVEDLNRVEFIGATSFKCDHRGQYNGSYIEMFPKEYREGEISKVFNSKTISILGSKVLKPLLEESGLTESYRGAVGVDCMVYRDDRGKLKINPVVEVNIRNSMGRVTLSLRGRVADSSSGVWKIDPIRGEESALKLSLEMATRYPLVLKNGEVVSGYVPMVEPKQEAQVHVYALVSSELDVCSELN